MDLSVVVPIHNEEENVDALCEELTSVLRDSGLAYEIILVDDGSTDRSYEHLERAQSRDENICVIKLARNYGQTAALAAGLANSRGRYVVTMDGDLQNDPREIPAMLARAREGYELVAGWRAERKDPFLSRRLPSRLANWLIGHITGVRLHDYGCTLKLIRGDLARSLRLYGEMHRFIPALINDLGGRVTEMKVNHRPRTAGRSKYGMSRVVRVILDLITVKFLSSYSTRPIHIFGLLGIAASGLGILILAYLSVQKLVFGLSIGGRPFLLLGILLVILGGQFFVMGLLGELLVRTYHESQGKPVYRVESVLASRATVVPASPQVKTAS